MSMVEILLDFIRSERNRNWILHLEAFNAMLPWLTIMTTHTMHEKTVPEVHAECLDGNIILKRNKR